MATDLPPPPRKEDARFDNWVFTLWKRAVAALVSGGVGATSPITITTSGTGTINLGHGTSGVVTGTYGSQSRIPIFAVNTWGHLTLATSSDVAIAGTAVTGADLSLTSPIIFGTGTGTNILLRSALIAHATSGAIPATYGNQSSVPILTVNTYGHVTVATSSAINIAGTAVTGADLTISAPLVGTATNALLRAGTIGHGTSGVTTGTYGGAASWLAVNVDTYGHVRAVSTFAPTGTAISGSDLTVNSPLLGTVTNALLRAGAISHSTSGVIGGTYGGALGLARVVVDTWGHVTAGTSFPLQATAPILVGSNAGTFTWGHSTSGIVSGTYGAVSVIPQVVVNTWGHITAINTLNVALNGTAITGADLTISAPLIGTATNALLRAGTIAHATSGVVTGTYGGLNSTPIVAVNTFGHVTSVSTVGWGTSTASFAAVVVNTHAIMAFPSNSTERGPWNFFASAVRGMGRRLYNDEDFSLGLNGVGAYNNGTAGAVTVTHGTHTSFEAAVAPPNSTGMSVKISYLNPPGAASPGFGGFYQLFDAEENHTLVQMFQAKLPSGRALNIAENSQGTNNTSYWLTSSAGTDKWEWYIRVSHCGDSGSFSNGGHVYVTGGADASFDWFLASSSAWDVTECPNFLTQQNFLASAPITFSVGTATAGTNTIGHSTSGVVTGTYGGALGVPRVIVDTYGHVTAGTTFPLQATAPIIVGSNAGTFTWGHTTSGIASGTYGGSGVSLQVVVNTFGHVTAASTFAGATSGKWAPWTYIVTSTDTLSIADGEQMIFAQQVVVNSGGDIVVSGTGQLHIT